MVGKAFDRVLAIKDLATKTERKLIDGLLKIDKGELIYLSITELSARLKIAEATVVRFCKKLGYNGFQDFKLSLSQELGMVDSTAVNSVVKRVALQMTDAITETSRSLSYDRCLEIAQLMINANKIDAFDKIFDGLGFNVLRATLGNNAGIYGAFANYIAKEGAL